MSIKQIDDPDVVQSLWIDNRGDMGEQFTVLNHQKNLNSKLLSEQ